MIDCLDTLWLLRAVGDWCRLIQVAVSCEASLFSKSKAVLLWNSLPVLQLWCMSPSTSLGLLLAEPIQYATRSVQVWRGKRILCETVIERCLEISTLTYVLKPRSLYITV